MEYVYTLVKRIDSPDPYIAMQSDDEATPQEVMQSLAAIPDDEQAIDIAAEYAFTSLESERWFCIEIERRFSQFRELVATVYWIGDDSAVEVRVHSTGEEFRIVRPLD